MVPQALGVLIKPCQTHGDVEPIQMMHGAGQELTHQSAHAVAAVRQEGERLVPVQALVVKNLEQPAPWLVVVGLDQAEVTVPAVFGHGLADDDLELPLLVVPVADVATIDADEDRPRGNRQLPRLGAAGLLDARNVPPPIPWTPERVTGWWCRVVGFRPWGMMPPCSVRSSTCRYRGGLRPCLTGPARG